MFYVLFSLLSLYLGFTILFAVTSFRERCIRAGLLGGVASLAMIGLLVLYGWAQVQGLLSGAWIQAIQIIIAAALLLATVSFFVPIGRNPRARLGTRGLAQGQPQRFNQKDTAFSIAHVGGYGPQAAKNRWALQSKDPFKGIFWTLAMVLRGQVDGATNPQRKDATPEAMTKEIKKVARYLGADLVGVTTVKEDFTYSDSFSYEESKVGVGPAVTRSIDLRHKYVIVLGKAMDYSVIQAALSDEKGVGLGEIGKSYHEVALLACSLAAYIRNLGYPARAHHVRNDEIMHVPHAVDAGLGEQGRHSYLMNAKYGPRVRLAAVTTDLELMQDKPVDIGVQDFCEKCRLCETNCPPRALSGGKTVVRGYERWHQDQDKCFNFWVSGANTFGCTMCINSCPWNKAPAFVHRVSFWAASRSLLARRVLHWLHVIFYGTKLPWRRIPLQEEVEMPPETQSWKR